MNISEFYKYSWFADLAYVEWNDSNQNGNFAVDAAVDAARAPQALAEKIFNNENYSVLSYHPNDDTGFKASLYGNGSEKILSICGTEPGSGGNVDLLVADIQHIGLVGFAFEQTISMFNYIQCLQANEGSNVLQITLHQEVRSDDLPAPQVEHMVTASRDNGLIDYYWFETETVAGAGLAKVTEGDMTGHSLGGHLATFALRLFPELFDQAVTFNVPGFDPITAQGLGLWAHQLTDEFLSELFGPVLTKPYAATFDDLASCLYVLESEDTTPTDDTSLVSSILTGGTPTAETFVTTEKNSHSMSQMVDALGVQALLETMNPDLTLTETGVLLLAASDDPGLSEEALINALSVLLLEGAAAAPIIDGETPFDRFSPPPFEGRTSLHQRLVELEVAIEGQNLTLTSLANLSQSDIQTLAQSDIAYRYALVNLNSLATDWRQAA